MKVTLGFGDGFTQARDIYEFYQTLIYFDTATEFSSLMKVGHTVVIIGDSYNGIAAAASIVIAKDVLFSMRWRWLAAQTPRLAVFLS